jgi:hypothetical protein
MDNLLLLNIHDHHYHSDGWNSVIPKDKRIMDNLLLLNIHDHHYHSDDNGEHVCLLVGDYPLFFYLSEWLNFTHLRDNGDHVCLIVGDYPLFFYLTEWKNNG